MNYLNNNEALDQLAHAKRVVLVLGCLILAIVSDNSNMPIRIWIHQIIMSRSKRS
jgi:hypothetical protein